MGRGQVTSAPSWDKRAIGFISAKYFLMALQVANLIYAMLAVISHTRATFSTIWTACFEIT